jgi:hypothetical protein
MASTKPEAASILDLDASKAEQLAGLYAMYKVAAVAAMREKSWFNDQIPALLVGRNYFA